MDPIKIDVTIKADQTLVDLLVYFGQCLIGIKNTPSEPQENKPKVKVKPEGEIKAKAVKNEEKEPKKQPAPAKESPFEGVDEENSVDLSDLENEPKTTIEPVETGGDPLTHEDARAAIKKARDRGINASQVKAIITGMGYDVLDAVPVEKLPEFISKVEAL